MAVVWALGAGQQRLRCSRKGIILLETHCLCATVGKIKDGVQLPTCPSGGGAMTRVFYNSLLNCGRRNQSGIFPRGAKSHKRRVHPSTIHSTHAACSPPSRSIVHAALWNYPTRAGSDPSPQDPGFLNHLDTWRPKIRRLLARKTV